MDFAAIYHFLFETYAGIGCMILACLVLTTIIAAVLERRTRRTYKDRGPAEGDEDWKFDDDKEQ